MYYRADGKAVCADIIPYYEDGKFYLFYLKDFRDSEKHGEGCPWYLITSEDLVNYTDCGEVLPRGSADEQDLFVFTGSCNKFNGEYYIFYTGHNPYMRKKGLPEQKILLAKSKDLLHWDKVKDFVLKAPDNFEMHDFRDPYVFYDEENKHYCMLIAGRLKNQNPVDTRGITIVAYSDDLMSWSISDKPFYAPSAFYTHECPDLFKMGDWWYLVFSEFTNKVVTTYRMARNINGPWITPKVNTFDGHAFYAAKTAFDGNHRYIFGWNCIKNNECDNEWWQWGGNIIPHEIVQDADGTLYVKCPDAIKNSYSVEIALKDGFELNSVYPTGNGYIIGSNDCKGVKMFGEMPENCKIEIDFTTHDDIGEFGVLLRATDELSQYYTIKFETKYNRMAFDKIPRRDGTIHIQADTERFCPIKPGIRNKMIIIVQGSIAEVYINDKVAMSVRMFDYKIGNFGLYAFNTIVRFNNIKIFKSE